MIEQLELLAQRQRELEQKRQVLNESVTKAVDILLPLREQMKAVVEDMKTFHEKEISYIELSRQTYIDLATSMKSIGKEMEHTQLILNEGGKLTASAISVDTMVQEQSHQQEKLVEPIITQDDPPKGPVQEVTEEIKRNEASADTLEAPQAKPMVPTSEEEVNQEVNQDTIEAAPLEAASVESEEETVLSETTADKSLKESEQSSDTSVEPFWEALQNPELYVIDEDEKETIATVRIPATIAWKHPELGKEVELEEDVIAITIEFQEKASTRSYIPDYKLTAQIGVVPGQFSYPLELSGILGEQELRRLVQLISWQIKQYYGIESVQNDTSVQDKKEDTTLEEDLEQSTPSFAQEESFSRLDTLDMEQE